MGEIVAEDQRRIEGFSPEVLRTTLGDAFLLLDCASMMDSQRISLYQLALSLIPRRPMFDAGTEREL